MYCFVVVFFILRRNSRWASKMAGKQFWEKWPLDSADTLQVKNFVKIDLRCTISEMYFCVLRKFKMVAKSGKKMIFGKSRQETLQICCGSKFR